MSTHTPGPWLAGQSITAAKPDRPQGSHERVTVAQRVNRRGDMALIAAAPDMLAALRELVAEFDNQDDDSRVGIMRDTGGIILARMALAKAVPNPTGA